MKKHFKLFLALLFLSTNLMCFAQNAIDVFGTITDQNGEPVIGASVLIKGTKIGTVTDLDGKYSLKAEKSNTLVISYVGYKTAEKNIVSSNVNLVLIEDAEALDEYVVIGYGVQKKSDLTGSLSSIKGEDISKSAASNITQGLQGKASGVYVTSNSGAPGAGATIRVRGFGSVSAGSSITPLYVVDGQPTSENVANAINPHDVESIEILKDASACAIFGTRGANGVIMITTKQGKEGKTSINFDASFGSSHAVNRIKMMNSDQLYNFLVESYKNDGLRMPRNITRLYTLDGEGLGPLDENGEPTNINVHNTNWWNETTRSAMRQNYNLSVSGGTDKLKSHFSIGYLTEEGIIKTSDFKRITARTNNEYSFNKYISIGQTLGLAYIKSHDLNMPISEILLPDPFTPVIAPNANKQDPNYEYNKYMPSQYSYYGNPVGVINRIEKENISRNIDGTAFANINLGLKGLYFKTLVGFDIPNYSYYEFTPKFDLRKNDSPYDMCTNLESKYTIRNNVYNYSAWELNYSLQNTLSYANTFGKHNISSVFGYTWESNESRAFNGRSYDLPSNKPPFHILDAGENDDVVGGGRGERYLISYLGRVNYSFDDRYLLTMSFRRDGSSYFARGNRWETFPSFSLGWKINNESFFKSMDIKAISGLKLRTGWGRNGNQEIGRYQYANLVSTYETWIYAFNSGGNTQQGYALTSVGNPDIKWETSEQTNIGIDASFFNNSLSLTADYYLKKTKGMLADLPIPHMSGIPNEPFTNAGSMENTGLEIMVGYKGNIADFTYSINTSIAFQQNKLTSTGDDRPLFNGSSTTKSEVGNPVGRYYGYVYDGIFQTPEEVAAHVGTDGVTQLQPLAKPGDFRFRNVNNDNKLGEDDMTYIGNPLPKAIYGGNINLAYKGIDMSLYFQGVAGNDIWVGTKQLLTRTSMTNLLAEAYTDAWRQAGDKTDIPAISRKDDNSNMRNSSWFVEDGSFCKIKTLQIGYTLPKKIVRATKVIESLRVYASFDNLLTITKFKYMDPEVKNEKVLDLGFENLQYPNPRVFTFGVNLQF